MLGTHVRRWREHRDWALWDEEHEGERTAEQQAWHAPVQQGSAVAALKDYTGFGYGAINGVLRSPEEYKGFANPDRIAEATAQGDLIHGVMRPLPDDATLYRGADAEMFGMVPPTMLDPATGKAGNPDWQSIVGGTFTDKGFTSTSHSERAAASEGRCSIVIHAPAGTSALDMQPYASNPNLNESEVLLDRGTTFKVTAVEHKSGRGPTVHVDVVK